ncbi:unnamed protein product [Closterium sp. NIES-53]
MPLNTGCSAKRSMLILGWTPSATSRRSCPSTKSACTSRCRCRGRWGSFSRCRISPSSSPSAPLPKTLSNTREAYTRANTALLDHVMLAVGYNYEGAGQWNKYFILKNSWGPQWGEGGYMRIKMENGPFGTCGMLVNRGLYPVVNGE